jgi:hypothetical protein
VVVVTVTHQSSASSDVEAWFSVQECPKASLVLKSDMAAVHFVSDVKETDAF